MNKPEYVKVDGKKYKINTDFRIAIECDTISRDINIGQRERALAIIYKLFGEEGLNCENEGKLIELAIKYISLGKEQKCLETHSRNNFEMDFNKCRGLISSSFKYDYNYDPYELDYLHWYTFYNDLENLSSNEFGNCCILNRIMALINYDTSQIKDIKERTKMEEAKKEYVERYCRTINQVEKTEEQERSMKEFYKQLGIEL